MPELLVPCTRPPEHPVRRVTVYYLFLAVAVTAVAWMWPPLLGYLRDNGQGLAVTGFSATTDVLPVVPGFHREVALVVSMLGGLALMLPVSWGYMGARRSSGFDQAVVQTVVILPMAVAGIVVMVKNSVALAFGLAGVVAGVRFRSALRDTADALYIFVAIGVGLAAGIGELGVAAVISIFLNYVILALWHCDFGECPVNGPSDGWSSAATGVKKKKKGGKKKERRQGKNGVSVEALKALEALPEEAP